MNLINIKEKLSNIRIIFLLILFIVIFLRLVNIVSEHLWVDEGGTIDYVSSSWSYLWKSVTEEKNPILYYVILKLWITMFGNSVFACRLLSVIFSVLTAPVLYLIGKEIKDEKLGFIIMFLFAISPFSIWYANEVRMYSLLHLLFTLIFYFSLKIIKESSNTKFYIYFSITAACLIYTHYIGLVYLTMIGFGIFLFNRKKDMFFKNAFISVIIIIASYVPWIPFAIGDVMGGPTAYTGGALSIINLLYWSFFFFISPVPSKIAIPYVFSIIMYSFLINLPLVIVSILGFIGFLYLYRNNDNFELKNILNFTILMILLIFGSQIVIGFLIPNTFQAKNLIGGMTLFHVIEGLGLYYLFIDKKSSFNQNLKKFMKFVDPKLLRKIFYPLIVTVLICNVIIFPIYKTQNLQKPDWNGCVKKLKKEFKSYDIVINQFGRGSLPKVMEYYCDIHDFDFDENNYFLDYNEEDIKDFMKFISEEGIHRIWIVYYWGNLDDPSDNSEDLLIDDYNLIEIDEYEFRIDIYLVLYEFE